MAFTGFKKSLFQFLDELARNNNREWFLRNKPRYESDVQGPALEFIESASPGLRKISPHIVAIAEKSGGSLMRIYRDVRFSKDKKPYNTHVGIQFRHSAGKGISAPGFYLHLDPKESFLGTGIWQPEPEALALIRNRIVEKPKEWSGVKDDSAFRKAFGPMAGESLKRPPRGYPEDHPFIDDLKRKDFVGFAPMKAAEIVQAGFPEEALRRFAVSRPLVRFICDALRLQF